MKIKTFILTATLVLFFNLSFSQNPLKGTWQNKFSGKLIMAENGKGLFNDEPFTYTFTSSSFKTQNNYGETYEYKYKIENDILTVSGGHFYFPVKFTKISSEANIPGAGSSGVIVTPSTGSNNQSAVVDQSIVGTWCWTNTSSTYTSGSSNTRCIIISGDGTYQYTYEGSISGYGGGYYGGSSSQSSDKGTWKVQGNKIIVNSAKEGTKTYSFEKKNHPKNGDPMIIIDGDAYVTYYQKKPW